MDPLDKLTITPEMLRRIAELDEFKGRWQAAAELAPERLSALRRVATVESFSLYLAYPLRPLMSMMSSRYVRYTNSPAITMLGTMAHQDPNARGIPRNATMIPRYMGCRMRR